MRWLDAGLGLAVLAIAIAAIVNLIQARAGPPVSLPSPPPPERAGPPTTVDDGQTEALPEKLPSLLPLPGAIREEGGVIWWTATECQTGSLDASAGSVDASSGSVQLLPDLRCEVWPALDGSGGVARIGSRLEVFAGREDSDPVVVRHPPGYLAGDLVWRRDGSAFAYCVQTGDGPIVEVISREGVKQRSVPGACVPAWLSDGRLAVGRVDPVSIAADGKVLLEPEAIQRLLPGAPETADRAVSALFASGGHLFASLVATPDERTLPISAALLVLSEAGDVEFSVELPPDSRPASVSLSPDRSALWYFEAGADRAVLIAIPGGRRLQPIGARWLAWDPSGRFLAAATEQGIVLSTWPRGRKLAVVPIDARAVSWTLRPAS